MEPTASVKIELMSDGNVRFGASGPDRLQLLGLLEVARSLLVKQLEQQQARPGLLLPVGPLPPFNGGR